MPGAPQGPVYQVAVLETDDFEPSPNPDDEMQVRYFFPVVLPSYRFCCGLTTNAGRTLDQIKGNNAQSAAFTWSVG